MEQKKKRIPAKKSDKNKNPDHVHLIYVRIPSKKRIAENEMLDKLKTHTKKDSNAYNVMWASRTVLKLIDENKRLTEVNKKLVTDNLHKDSVYAGINKEILRMVESDIGSTKKELEKKKKFAAQLKKSAGKMPKPNKLTGGYHERERFEDDEDDDYSFN